MPKCLTNISSSPVTITLPGRASNPAPGDAYVDDSTGKYFVYVNGLEGWMEVNEHGRRVSDEEQEREELHAKYPQLAKLWEEYSIMKKLYVGDTPRKDNDCL